MYNKYLPIAVHSITSVLSHLIFVDILVFFSKDLLNYWPTNGKEGLGGGLLPRWITGECSFTVVVL